MRITFICQDTHGGVEPYVALAVGLQRSGHEALLVAPENFAGFAAAHGIPFSPLSGNVQAFLRSPEFAAVAAKGFLAVQKLAMRKAAEYVTRWMAEAMEACVGSDLIVAGIGGYPVAAAVAERLGIRCVQAHLQPLTTTAAIPGPLAPGWFSWFGGVGHRFGHALTHQLLWQPARVAVNRARRAVLGLSEAPIWGRIGHAGSSCSPVLYGFSRHVWPPPAEWKEKARVTGYWFLDKAPTWQPPAILTDFLAAGLPPVVIGFGSMADRDPEGMVRMVVAATKEAGVRAVLLSGWASLRAADLGSSICAVESAAHDWLYPRTALVVHHGGAGTTGATFRAGVPGVIVPFAAEQPFWGRRVAALGCGPAPIPRRRLTATRLADAICEGLREPYGRRAAALGERVRAEVGVAEAVGHLTT